MKYHNYQPKIQQFFSSFLKNKQFSYFFYFTITDNNIFYDIFCANIFIKQMTEQKKQDLIDEINKCVKLLINGQISPNVFYRLGLANYSLKNYQDAKEHFLKANGLQEGYCDSYHYLGNISYLFDHNQQAALSWYQKSIAANGKNFASYNCIGKIMRSKRNFPKAQQNYRKCIEINPQNCLALNGLGNVLCDTARIDQAITFYTKAIESNSKYDCPYNGLGNAYRLRGQINKAVEYYLKCLYINPKNEDAKNNLNSINIKNDNTDEFENRVNQKPIIRKQTDSIQKTFHQQMSQLKKDFSQIMKELTSTVKVLAEQTKNIKTEIKNQNQKKIKFNQLTESFQLEARDQELFVQFSSISNQNLCQNNFKKQLQLWVRKMTRIVISVAFNFCLKGNMIFSQAKVFICENVFKNIFQLYQAEEGKYKNTINQLGPQFFKIVNQTLKSTIFEAKQKYPLNQETEIPYHLQKYIRDNHIENSDSIDYDFFNVFDNEFELRSSGNYNDLIMKVINKLIKVTETYYEPFKKQITQIFEGILIQIGNKNDNVDKQQLEQKKKKKKNINHINLQIQQAKSQVYSLKNQNTQKHKNKNIVIEVNQHKQKDSRHQKKRERRKREMKIQKLKAQTMFVVKRKIPQGIKIYSDDQIQDSQKMSIKDKSILRIITKWCEQLEGKFTELQKYEDESNIYFFKNQYSDHVSKEHINGDHIQKLTELLKNEYKNIKIYFRDYLEDSNIRLQFQLLKAINEGDLQSKTCTFSAQVIQNHVFLILKYLNRLIHGILIVSKQFSIYLQDEANDIKNYTKQNINLLTFKIKDLIRCKVSAKSTQSFYFLKQLIQNGNNSLFKIIRVKNRLYQNTNDALVNLFFEKSVICQIQINVHSQSSKFINFSVDFNHMLYQMQRNKFGTINELSNIFSSFDLRIQRYGKKYKQKSIQLQKQKQNKLQCCKINQQDTKTNIKPFVCNFCLSVIYHNFYLIFHKICKSCKKIQCALCHLQKMQQNQIKKILFSKQNNHNYSQRDSFAKQNRYNDPNKNFPEDSLWIQKDSKQKRIQKYIKIKTPTNSFLINVQIIKDQIKCNDAIKQKQIIIKQILSNYIIFQIQNSYDFQIFRKDIKQQLLFQKLKSHIKKCKSALIIQSIVKKDFWQNIIQINKIQNQSHENNQNRMKEIKYFALKYFQSKQNQISLSFLSQIIHKFQNLQYLSLNRIMAKQISKIQLKKIKFLSLENQTIETFQNIQIQWPQQLLNFQFQSIIGCDQNYIIHFPPFLQKCSKLKSLTLVNIQIKQLPNIFHKLYELENMTLVKLNLSTLPSTFEHLKKLSFLNLQENKFTQIPLILNKNENLTYLNLTENEMPKIQFTGFYWRKIQILILKACYISQLDIDFKQAKYLKQIILSYNQLQTLKTLRNVKSSVKIIMKNSLKRQKQLSSDQLFNFFSISNCKKIIITDANLTQLNKPLIFKQIITLKIQQCSLKVFPDVKLSPNLLSLSLKCNNLSQINQNVFDGCLQLKNIDLSQNPIKKLPSSMIKLYNLQILKLKQCQIQEFPQQIKYLKNIKNLQFRQNCLKQIPDFLFQNCPFLQQLNFKNNNKNQYLKISPKIYLLTKLTKGNFSGCNLKQVPENIQKCQNLTYLNLSNNLITIIPNNFSKLSKLKNIQIDDNKFSKLKNIIIIQKMLNQQGINLIDQLSNYEGNPNDQQQNNAFNELIELQFKKIKKQIKDTLFSKDKEYYSNSKKQNRNIIIYKKYLEKSFQCHQKLIQKLQKYKIKNPLLQKFIDDFLVIAKKQKLWSEIQYSKIIEQIKELQITDAHLIQCQYFFSWDYPITKKQNQTQQKIQQKNKLTQKYALMQKQFIQNQSPQNQRQIYSIIKLLENEQQLKKFDSLGQLKLKARLYFFGELKKIVYPIKIMIFQPQGQIVSTNSEFQNYLLQFDSKILQVKKIKISQEQYNAPEIIYFNPDDKKSQDNSSDCNIM